jgi:hypothetical protein
VDTEDRVHVGENRNEDEDEDQADESLISSLRDNARDVEKPSQDGPVDAAAVDVGKSEKPDSEKTHEEKEIAALKKEIEELKARLAELEKKQEEKMAEPAGAAPAGGGGGGGGGDKGPSVGVNAPQGFLWKPVSDSDGNLAILLPPGMTGQVASVSVLSPNGQVLAQGRSGGVGNGDREHFRFDRPGGAFPPGSIVQITMKDGSQQQVVIEQPNVRNEGSGGGKK